VGGWVKSKIRWIYEIRGLAILGVVICHMQGRTHQSEWVQFLTIYSVPVFIFLMGYTRTISLNRFCTSPDFIGSDKKWTLMNRKTVNDILKFIPEYLLFCVFSVGNLYNWDSIFGYALIFDESAYFLKDYIILVILSPYIYSGILTVNRKTQTMWKRFVLYFLLCAAAFSIIYIRFDFFVNTYLFVYTLGMIISFTGVLRWKRIYLIPALMVLTAGFYEGHKAYFTIEGSGNYAYSGGIDLITMGRANPTLSQILYGAGVFLVVYWLFELLNSFGGKAVSGIMSIFSTLGKYSFDIFIWHKLIRDRICIPGWDALGSEAIWLKRLWFYGIMIGLPVLVKWLFERIKLSAFQENLQITKDNG
jgi:hypothetical protein